MSSDIAGHGIRFNNTMILIKVETILARCGGTLSSVSMVFGDVCEYKHFKTSGEN